MSKLPRTDGRKVLRFLCNKKECKTLSSKGGHAKVESPAGKRATIPVHGKLKVGTLEGILKRLEIPEDVFIKEWEEY